MKIAYCCNLLSTSTQVPVALWFSLVFFKLTLVVLAKSRGQHFFVTTVLVGMNTIVIICYIVNSVWDNCLLNHSTWYYITTLVMWQKGNCICQNVLVCYLTILFNSQTLKDLQRLDNHWPLLGYNNCCVSAGSSKVQCEAV